MIAPHDEDSREQQEARVRRAMAREAEILTDALRRLVRTGSAEARWLRELAGRLVHQGITAEERFHLRRLAWFHRRTLPAHLAPRLNPGDPLVMEIERAQEIGAMEERDG